MNDMLGHNRPPEPTALERAESLVVACDGWTTKGPLQNEDEARELTEFLVQVRKSRDVLRAGVPERQQHLDALAAIRATVAHLMEPHEQALEQIGARSAALLPRLDLAIERIAGSKRVPGLLADWIKRKDAALKAEADAKRKAAEEAERIAEHAQDRAGISGTIDDAITAREAVEAAAELRDAAGRAPARAQVKGDLALKAVSLREYWSAEVVDWKAAGRHYKGEARVINGFRKAVQMCADDDARRLKDPALAPPGVRFHKREQAQ